MTAIEWDESGKRWVISTDRGDRFTASYIGVGTGPLHVPKLPGISGIESFKGHSFHTSRWDYDYTGGDAAGRPMTGLADKRVAIIGTGATSVQAVPYLARDAERLYRRAAHAVLGRRAGQCADRSKLVCRHRHAGLANGAG